MNKKFSFTKVNSSSLKVLQTLKLLIERDMSMDELINFYQLYHNEQNTNFVISKYINTCRYCGINIPKINNKYTINNFPIGINFSANEISLFEELKNCCEKFRIDELCENMQGVLFKVNQRLKNPLLIDYDQRNKDVNVKLFEKAIHEKSIIKLTLNNDEVIQCEPVEISVQDNKLILVIFDKNRHREFFPSDIKTLKLTPLTSKRKHVASTTVVFELKNPLAKKYQIRKNEQILKVANDGTMTISNRFEDKNKLLKRLMRYGDLCKISSPKSYAEEMKIMIKKTLENYN